MPFLFGFTGQNLALLILNILSYKIILHLMKKYNLFIFLNEN